MRIVQKLPLGLAATMLALACGAGEPADEEEMRDLTLAPAESLSTIGDVPEVEPEQPAPPRETTQRQPQQRTPPPPPRQREPDPEPQPAPQPDPEPTLPTAGQGTSFTLFATDTLASRVNKAGDPVTAMLGADIVDANGDVIIPAGAVFSGSIQEIAPAPNPDADGTLVLSFNQVAFGGKSYAIAAQQDSIGAYTKGRGLEASQAATVGAGAVIGGIAGRVIGGNRTGTIVGAAAGAIAGAGIAAATRDEDVILDAGAPIVLRLVRDFVLLPLSGT